jgi:hypothetical protein
MTRLLIITFLSCFAFDSSAQQKNLPKKVETTLSLPKRKIDPEKLNHFSWAYSGNNLKTDCREFICNYREINEQVIYIKPFLPESVLKDTSLFSFAPSFYKEVEEEKIQHGRMLYKSKKILLFISGDSSKYYMIDTARRGYLVQVFHSNGIESWYYPVYNPPSQLNAQKPGEQIGVSSGSFFWQLRFRNRSFLVSGILDRSYLPDNKGILIENIKLASVSPAIRYRGFVEAVKSNLKETDLKQNFSDDFNKQMNEKQ